jgi:hypothetical protein
VYIGKKIRYRPLRFCLKLKLIGVGKPNQSSYNKSLNERCRGERPNEHWVTGPAHARSVIEKWRREPNDLRPTTEDSDRPDGCLF